MLISFKCEHCGKPCHADERFQGRRGRCSHCGRVMVIPHLDAHAHEGPTPRGRDSDAPFRLSPPDERPHPAPVPPIPASPGHPESQPHPTHGGALPFELIDEEVNPESEALASPAVRRGLRELDEFRKDPHPYKLVDGLEERFLTRWARDSGPAGWLVVKWRQGVGLILRVLRWVDDWAYLISVPFIVLAIFAIAVQNPKLVHLGAVVVVLANYGRFWVDLVAVFVRPWKEGPVHGLAFLFPPYGIYYLRTRWDKFKPTFRRLLTSCIPIVLVVLAYAYLPVVNPAAGDAKDLPEKIRSGGRELVREIRDDLKDVQEKIPSLEDPKPRGSESKP